MYSTEDASKLKIVLLHVYCYEPSSLLGLAGPMLCVSSEVHARAQLCAMFDVVNLTTQSWEAIDHIPKRAIDVAPLPNRKTWKVCDASTAASTQTQHYHRQLTPT